MRSNLRKEITDLLEKHSCASFFIVLQDPDSTEVWSIFEGNRQWIYGELCRWNTLMQYDWVQESRIKDDEEDDYER